MKILNTNILYNLLDKPVKDYLSDIGIKAACVGAKVLNVTILELIKLKGLSVNQSDGERLINNLSGVLGNNDTNRSGNFNNKDVIEHNKILSDAKRKTQELVEKNEIGKIRRALPNDPEIMPTAFVVEKDRNTISSEDAKFLIKEIKNEYFNGTPKKEPKFVDINDTSSINELKVLLGLSEDSANKQENINAVDDKPTVMDMAFKEKYGFYDSLSNDGHLHGPLNNPSFKEALEVLKKYTHQLEEDNKYLK
jgi:hypothetical protein